MTVRQPPTRPHSWRQPRLRPRNPDDVLGANPVAVPANATVVVPPLPLPNLAVVPYNTSHIEVLPRPVESAQYTSNDYLDFCLDQRRQLRPSVGHTGVCWDNAVAESFWESLKRECVQGRVFATRADARRAIFRWVNWYNPARLHGTLNDIP